MPSGHALGGRKDVGKEKGPDVYLSGSAGQLSPLDLSAALGWMLTAEPYAMPIMPEESQLPLDARELADVRGPLGMLYRPNNPPGAPLLPKARCGAQAKDCLLYTSPSPRDRG